MRNIRTLDALLPKTRQEYYETAIAEMWRAAIAVQPEKAWELSQTAGLSITKGSGAAAMNYFFIVSETWL